ncbi:hypothetical protein [Comamonas testosteroni]|uniref:Uncharacterized protein n=1 Tax=Comamonas testosteroni TaxID=285 RepID=A0A096GPD2_COMTE|nr:hypothetical protein [Comamonas testosteroni]KGH27015.1 hypothetical protein P353_19700 [Comamonas testosteroni]
MKLQTDNLRLGNDLSSLLRALAQVLPDFAKQVNAVSEGRLSGSYNALTSPPTTGKHQAGDYIKNSAPEVLGTAGAQYVLKGWICVAGGEPGTWAEDRGMTGT